MINEALVDSLAKLIIAAAWADNDLTPEEVNGLRDLLFQYYGTVAEKTGDARSSWTQFEMYLDSPVGPAERARLEQELQAALHSQEDKEIALDAVRDMVQADGVVTAEERAVLEEIEAAIDAVDVSAFEQIGGALRSALRGALARRSDAMSDAPNRERYYDEYLKNKVYYDVATRLELGEGELDVSDEDLHKLSAAGGLMAKVAVVDREVTQDELETMMEAMSRRWEVNHNAAAFVAEVAVAEVSPELDYLRLTREFVENTNLAERSQFIDVLFEVANGDGYVTEEEIQEIYRIGRSLLLSRQTVTEAKLRIPSERRAL
jgi:uncharacterized tellurite resistance protein B-like protein